MPAGDMRDFMGDNAGNFLFAVQCFKEAAVDENLTARSCKCIVGVFLYDMKMVWKRLRRHDRQDFIADLVDIIRNDRIMYDLIMFVDSSHEFPGQFFFFLDGNGSCDFRKKHQHNQQPDPEFIFSVHLSYSPP